MNTKANRLQEKPFIHTSNSVNISDIFNSKSRPMSGKSVTSFSRPVTAGSQTQLKFIRPESAITSRVQSGKTRPLSSRPKNHLQNSTCQTSTFNQGAGGTNFQKKMNSSFISDPNEIECLKGKFIGSTTIDSSGIISIEGIPYDSYLVEIEESKNFQICAEVVKFNSMQENNFLRRFVGLIPQVNATPTVFVYQKKEGEDDYNLLGNCDVYLKRCLDSVADSTFDDSSNIF